MNKHKVNLFYDDVMLEHHPEVDLPFVPSRVEKRVRNLLKEFDFKWSYPEHPGRLTTVLEYLEPHPIPGVEIKSGSQATYEQLSRVHTASQLDDIFALEGKRAWLDRDTTAVSPGSIQAAKSAAGNAIAAVESVVNDSSRSAFALVRPPGASCETGAGQRFLPL
jgi:acetoin utilization deacetylase AcuC-like enzyme